MFIKHQQHMLLFFSVSYLIRLLLSVTTILVSLSATGFSITSVDAANEFRITPTEYRLTITSQQPLELKYTFENNLSSALKFVVSLSPETKARLDQYGVTLSLEEEDRETRLSTEQVGIVVDANSEKIITIKLEPGLAQDYSLAFTLDFRQFESETKLVTDEYSLKIIIDSELGNARFIQLETIVAVAILVIALLSLGVFILLKLRKR